MQSYCEEQGKCSGHVPGLAASKQGVLPVGLALQILSEGISPKD